MPHRGSDQADYMREYRRTNKRYAAEDRLRKKARARALTRLAKLFPIEFAALELEELRRLQGEQDRLPPAVS